MKSIDGGLNWNPTSLGPSNSPSSIYEIEMHFNDLTSCGLQLTEAI